MPGHEGHARWTRHWKASCSTARSSAAGGADLQGLPARRQHSEGVWQRRFSGREERDRLLLALLAYAGLRRAELLGLDIDDVDLNTMLLRVRRAKGGKDRVLPIHPALVPLFDAYLVTRLPIGTERALFFGVHGRRLSATILSSTFRRYAEATGVAKRKRVTPHTLRHVFATELLAAGANLRQIQELLGHKHVDSTSECLRVPGCPVVAAFPPRDGKLREPLGAHWCARNVHGYALHRETPTSTSRWEPAPSESGSECSHDPMRRTGCRRHHGR